MLSIQDTQNYDCQINSISEMGHLVLWIVLGEDEGTKGWEGKEEWS